ncbi:chemotaxis protein CheW [Myxococcota bacterium]|nr:chemotaxis protein CheW [Myxococcota bacterium]
MTTSSRDFLVFQLARARWALPIAEVREILPAALPVPLPEAPAIVDGLLDLHGELVPVLDLRVRLGGEKRPLDPSEHFVVTCVGARLAALRVDRVLDVVHVPEESIDEHGLGGRSISGAVRVAGDLVLVHDLARLLDDAESAALARTIAEHAAAREVAP